jgi:hypothetical protein
MDMKAISTGFAEPSDECVRAFGGGGMIVACPIQLGTHPIATRFGHVGHRLELGSVLNGSSASNSATFCAVGS